MEPVFIIGLFLAGIALGSVGVWFFMRDKIKFARQHAEMKSESERADIIELLKSNDDHIQ